MNAALFGTDGIRARFGEEPLTESTVRRIALALGAHLAESGAGSGAEPPVVAVGGDTRASTPALAAWLEEGLAASGVATLDLGVLPTPAIAWWTARAGAAAGVAISASHNPAEDNGIKLIDRQGYKWGRAEEERLERRLSESAPRVRVGPAPRRQPDAAERYLSWLIGEGGDTRALAGLRVALDAANGAAAALAGPLFRALGAEATVFFDRPNGENINLACGSTAPQALAREMAAGAFDLGFTFDGDADRCLLVDELGEPRDGDAMLFLWARELKRLDGLADPRIVATSMSNLGLEHALAAVGVGVVRCDVGDREVVATLRRRRLRLGGEQSGHLIDLHRATTGDGLLTAVVLAAILARGAGSQSVASRSAPVSGQLADFRRFPQVLINVPVSSKPAFDTLASVAAAARAAEARLGAEGRLVLRYSGTEPLARVMIEGPDEATVKLLADEIASALRDAIGVSKGVH